MASPPPAVIAEFQASLEADAQGLLADYLAAFRAEGGDLEECGGAGSGKPGPCPTGDDDGPHASLIRAAVAKVAGHLSRQYGELAAVYGKPATLVILGVAALPIPGTALAPLAAKVLARAVAAFRAAGDGPALEAEADLAAAVAAVKALILAAHAATGESPPGLNDDAIRVAVRQATQGNQP